MISLITTALQNVFPYIPTIPAAPIFDPSSSFSEFLFSRTTETLNRICAGQVRARMEEEMLQGSVRVRHSKEWGVFADLAMDRDTWSKRYLKMVWVRRKGLYLGPAFRRSVNGIVFENGHRTVARNALVTQVSLSGYCAMDASARLFIAMGGSTDYPNAAAGRRAAKALERFFKGEVEVRVLDESDSATASMRLLLDQAMMEDARLTRPM